MVSTIANIQSIYTSSISTHELERTGGAKVFLLIVCTRYAIIKSVTYPRCRNTLSIAALEFFTCTCGYFMNKTKNRNSTNNTISVNYKQLLVDILVNLTSIESLSETIKKLTLANDVDKHTFSSIFGTSFYGASRN